MVGEGEGWGGRRGDLDGTGCWERGSGEHQAIPLLLSSQRPELEGKRE